MFVRGVRRGDAKTRERNHDPLVKTRAREEKGTRDAVKGLKCALSQTARERGCKKVQARKG